MFTPPKTALGVFGALLALTIIAESAQGVEPTAPELDGLRARIEAVATKQTTATDGSLRALVIPYIPAPGRANQGLVSFENYAETEEPATFGFYDEHGTHVAGGVVRLPPGTTRWASSSDLLNGNSRKGIIAYPFEEPSSKTLWVHAIASTNVLIHAYIRSPEGFVTSMSRTAETVVRHDFRIVAVVPFFNPASSTSTRSVLRLVNADVLPRTVDIAAWDSDGNPGESTIRCALPAQSVISLTATALEAGPSHPDCTSDGWGNGVGRWWVQVQDAQVTATVMTVMSLLHSVDTGLVTNLSAPALPRRGVDFSLSPLEADICIYGYEAALRDLDLSVIPGKADMICRSPRAPYVKRMP